MLRTARAASVAVVAACCAPETEPGASETPGTASTTAGPETPTTAGADDSPTTASADDSPTTTSGAAGSSTSPEVDGTTGVAGPFCGDGHVDPGEVCDPGLAEIGDDRACTALCQKAACGDGLIWAGQEECDAGAANDDDLYDGCTTKCLLGPRCDDGEVQEAEECDAGALNGTEQIEDGAEVRCSGECRFAARLLFVTSVGFSGALNGLAGADARCEDLANAAGLDNAGGFRAWLSVPQATAASRFAEAEGEVLLPVVLPSGVKLADSVLDLIDAGPRAPVSAAESGASLPGPVYVWTNTGLDGGLFHADQHCQSWSAPVGYSRVGRSAPKVGEPLAAWRDGELWTSADNKDCAEPRHLYCLETGAI